jgi:hypothetical protein
MAKIEFASMPALGTQAAMVSALARIGLFVPNHIAASASNHGIDEMVAAGMGYETWQIDEALARTNLNTQQKIQFKLRLESAGLLIDDVNRNARRFGR